MLSGYPISAAPISATATTVPLYAVLSGVSATGAVGAVGRSISVPLSAVTVIGSAGFVGSNRVFGLSGVYASVNVGDRVIPTYDSYIYGQLATLNDIFIRAYKYYTSSITESAIGSDLFDRAGAPSQINESAEMSDTVSIAASTYSVQTSETGTISDFTDSAGSILSATLTESAQLSDNVSAFLQAFVAVHFSASISAETFARDFWQLINDTQTPSWADVLATQNLAWAPTTTPAPLLSSSVDTTQTPDWGSNITGVAPSWTPIESTAGTFVAQAPTTQTPNWIDVPASSSTSWTDI